MINLFLLFRNIKLLSSVWVLAIVAEIVKSRSVLIAPYKGLRSGAAGIMPIRNLKVQKKHPERVLFCERKSSCKYNYTRCTLPDLSSRAVT